MEELKKELRERLVFKFNFLDLDGNEAEESIFRQLSRGLAHLDGNSLVLLIDEYDAPLTACLDDHDLFNSVGALLSKVYALFKSNDRVFRFMFITGITKFNKASIFSELNNLSDLSLSPRYGTLLGYTHQEIQEYFGGYLNAASETLGISNDDLLERLTQHYDGFCFERTVSRHVFTPWSILKFFSDPESGLLDYWFESGGRPSALVQYLKSHTLRSPEEYDKEKEFLLTTLSGSSDVEALSDIGLLTQTGYLTLKAVKGDVTFVNYPNLEVRHSMAQLYMEQLLDGRLAVQVGAGSIAKVLADENAESLFHILNRLFIEIDYKNCPVKNEASVRAFVQVYFAGAKLETKVGHHNAYGRSDLEVEVNDRHWVLEFKVVHARESKEEKLKEALEQLSTRHYGEHSNAKELLRVALVFSINERKFVAWVAL